MHVCVCACVRVCALVFACVLFFLLGRVKGTLAPCYKLMDGVITSDEYLWLGVKS
uniref:Uncharacterized protein n=1 Tax=Anguilla anguilla TaxID=7936 RepID=A0A0E9SJB8_ANGAN